MTATAVFGTARKTIFSFSGRPEKMIFPKKVRWNMIFLVLSDVPKIWSYTLDGKWKMIFLKKYTEIWYFLQAYWKYGLSKRCCTGTWPFLHYLERWYFFSERSFYRRQKTKDGPFQEIHGNIMHRKKKKNTGNLIHRVEVWSLLKFIRLEIFYNE